MAEAVSNVDTSRVASEAQLQNIDAKVVALPVSKCDKSRDLSELQPENICSNEVEADVLNDEILISSREAHR